MATDMYKSINENSLLAIGVYKILCDEKGLPIDYEFVEVNPAYERLTGLKAEDITGKKATDVFPENKDHIISHIDIYGDIATKGGSREYKHFYDAIHDYYNVKIYSPEKNYFVLMFSDIKTSPVAGKSYSFDNLFEGNRIDFTEIQAVIDSFFNITNIAMAIGNLEGRLLVKTEFQDICKNFHRCNAVSIEKCIISDAKMFQSTVAGEFLEYKCLNNLRDISTPIIFAGKIIGAIYIGQFFYDDEDIDYDIFIKQANEYGYDKEEYLKALERVPRVSHEYIRNVTHFYIEFAKVIALLSYKNIDILSAHEKQGELFESLKKMETKLHSVINSLPDVVMLYDKDYRIRYINEAIYRLLGRHKEEIIGKKDEEIWRAKGEKQHLPVLKKAMKTKELQSIDIECACPTGLDKNLLFTYIPLVDGDETEILGIIHDYTSFKLSEEKYYYQNSLINEMGRAAKIGGWEFDPETGKGSWTDEVARIHDLNPNDETNMELGLSFYTQESQELLKKAIQEAVEEAKPYDLELELISKTGAKKWIRTIGKPTTKGGKVVRVHGAFQDISERKKNEERIKESEIRYRTLLEKAPVGIAVHAKGKIVFANPAALVMFGAKKPEELIGVSIFDFIHPSGLEKTMERIKKVMAGEKGLYPAEDLYVKKDGTTMPVELLATPIIYQGKPAVQVIVTDITERKKGEERLRYLGYHDQLTGIYNRRFFEEELKKIDNDKNLPLTIVMADLNGLKLINDSFGHSFGDELLIKASEAFKKTCREGDILARLGGDEFVLLLPKTDSAEAEDLIKKVRKSLQNESVKSVALSLSFGYETKENKNEKIQDILANAENHMYRHKIYESSSLHSKSVEIIMNTLYEKSKRELMHSKRVSKYCESIALALNLEKDSVNQIKTAGLVHDIGKIGVDEKILNKSGNLTGEEWVEMKKHPERGWRILTTSSEFSELADFVLEHQERWDGKGYPNGLKGEQISLEARIIALADSYDAMTSKRSYRKAMSKEDAIKELIRNEGKQFDKALVTVFVEKVLNKGISKDSSGKTSKK